MANLKLKPNTKVRVNKMRGESHVSGINPGDIAYVTSWTGRGPGDNNVIPVQSTPDGTHGFWCLEWEVLDEDFLDLTEDQKQMLSDKALISAKKRGYCDETKKVLADLGLPTEASRKTEKVVVELELEIKDGFYFYPENLQYNDTNTKNGSPVITIVGAEVQDTRDDPDDW